MVSLTPAEARQSPFTARVSNACPSRQPGDLVVSPETSEGGPAWQRAITVPLVCLFLQTVASLRGPSQVGASSGCPLGLPWLWPLGLRIRKALGGGRWDQLNYSLF